MTLYDLQIYALGFIGQALFGARLIIQWIRSEKKGEVLSPTIYWQLSLLGSLLFLWYGIFRTDLVIVVGQFLSYFIYIRNLQLKGYWRKWNLTIRSTVVFAPLLSIGWFTFNVDQELAAGAYSLHPVLIAGVVGQLALNLRFLYQWYYSELAGDSVLPYGFWAISVWSSVLVILYSVFHPIYSIEPVLLVSQTMGIVVYIRNMMIARKQRNQNKQR